MAKATTTAPAAPAASLPSFDDGKRYRITVNRTVALGKMVLKPPRILKSRSGETRPDRAYMISGAQAKTLGDAIGTAVLAE